MTLAWPWALGLLAPMILLLIWQLRRRQRNALPFSSLHAAAAAGRTWRQRLVLLPPVLQFLTLSCLIVALARPQKDAIESKQVKEGIAIELLMDVSSSMDMSTAFGRSETRLEAAKQVMEAFVAGDGEELPGRPDDLIGIVTFARYADTICPLTMSRDAVVHMTREIEVQNRPNEDGTAYGDATALAAAHLKMFEERQAAGRGTNSMPDIKSKIIVLLTDGENNCGKHLPLQAAGMAREWGIRVYTISFGDKPQIRQVETSDGRMAVPDEMSATEKVLRQMADSTGGIFRRAADLDSLRSVYAEIDRLEKTELKPLAYTRKQEAYGLFLLVALGLLYADVWIRSLMIRMVP
ncbi:MAG: Ca-activated chloride channel family protein [Rhodothermales bacterium]|jgi:Ca-activated chloride channel family protein